jgi:hypothetical protein
VALSPMPSAADEDDPLTISSTSYDLDLVVDMVISSIGLLELDIPTLIKVSDMYSFQCSSLPSSEYLLKSMIDFCPLTCIPYRELSSWNP